MVFLVSTFGVYRLRKAELQLLTFAIVLIPLLLEQQMNGGVYQIMPAIEPWRTTLSAQYLLNLIVKYDLILVM
ncbi:hypothetical protein DQZ53_23285 [Salmonella enterica subsp. enterica serovar Bareilly]|nr:hypothetical protein [Salmonella enterica subsp. enterica serovar Bareilly]